MNANQAYYLKRKQEDPNYLAKLAAARRKKMEDPEYRAAQKAYFKGYDKRRQKNPSHRIKAASCKKKRRMDAAYCKKQQKYQRDYRKRRRQDPVYRKKWDEYNQNWRRDNPEKVHATQDRRRNRPGELEKRATAQRMRTNSNPVARLDVYQRGAAARQREFLLTDEEAFSLFHHDCVYC